LAAKPEGNSTTRIPGREALLRAFFSVTDREPDPAVFDFDWRCPRAETKTSRPGFPRGPPEMQVSPKIHQIMPTYIHLTMDEWRGTQSAEKLGYLGFAGTKVFTRANSHGHFTGAATGTN